MLRAICFCVLMCVGAKRGMVCREPVVWVHADASCKRLDEKYLISQRVQMPLPHLAALVSQVCVPTYCF